MAAKKKEKIVYIALGCEPKEGEHWGGMIVYTSGWSKKKTNWYKYEIELSRLERYASMYDYKVIEGAGYYKG